MEGLPINILGADEIDTLFSTEKASEEETHEEEGQEQDAPDNQEENNETTTTETKGGTLFEEGPESESVGSEDDQEGEEEGSSTEDGGGTSPNDNFYSSIASAMAEDGIFPNLDEETIKKADSAEALSDLIEAEVNARLDETQKRISKALGNGVEQSDIMMYETTLNNIANITDQQLSDESEKGEQLRYNVIFQDFINKGYSRERADKMTKRSIDAGTDIEDAKEALLSNKEYFQNKYNALLEDAQKKADKDKEERKKQSEKLRESMLKDKDLLGDLEIPQDVRRKAFENISKPIYKDPDTGDYLTAVQRYEQEHPVEFIKYVGLIMTMTNNFKDFESFTKGKVKKEVRKGMRALEQTLNSTRRNSDGSLRMVAKSKDDPESIIPSGFKLAL